MRNPVAATRMMRGLLAGLICTFSILVPSAPVRAAVERTSDGTDAVDPYAIGCILPLTGKHAPYGKKAQDAILLARRLADPGGRRTLKVLFEDSHGQPDAAAAAVTRLAERGRVIGLLGLLGQAEAIEAASAAQGRGVPILTLSQNAAITDIGDQVFRNALTPDMQAEALVNHARQESGFRRFAILYPDDAYGREMKDRFEEAVRRRGGAVVVTRGYARGQTDFRDEIRALAGLPEQRDTEEAASGPDAGRAGHVGFEALFLPDGAGTVSLIAAQLSFYDLTGILLLGTPAWNRPELFQNDLEGLEGAVFVDEYDAGSHRPELNDFTDRFYAAYGREPDGMEALAFDGAAILFKVILDGAPESRRQFRDRLQAVKDYPGVTGMTTFLPTREAAKDCLLFGVRNGRIVRIR